MNIWVESGYATWRSCRKSPGWHRSLREFILWENLTWESICHRLSGFCPGSRWIPPHSRLTVREVCSVGNCNRTSRRPDFSFQIRMCSSVRSSHLMAVTVTTEMVQSLTFIFDFGDGRSTYTRICRDYGGRCILKSRSIRHKIQP